MEKRNIIAFIIIAASAWFAMCYTTKVLDKSFVEYDKYEACVLEQYGRTPSSFREEHGFLPEC